MVQRLDHGTLGTAAKTPQGGLAIPATLTRAGVFVYRKDGHEVREWRPMAEVSRQATLDSLKNATLTVRHPGEGAVTPRNYQRLAAGHVGSDVRMDGTQTAATVYVQSEAGLRAIESGWRDVSCGYTCDTDEAPGTVPEGEPDAGQPYDRIQRNIQYNHNAIVPKGRAGTARLHLDAADNAVEDEPMKIESISGIEYEVGTPAHADARKRADEAAAATAAELAKLRADAAEQKGKLAALEAEAARLKAAEKVRADEAERAALVAKAAVVLGKDWKADGKDNAAITAEILAKRFPEVKLDEHPEAERPAFLKGLFAGIKAEAEKRNDGAGGPPRRGPQPFATAEVNARGNVVQRARLDNADEMDGLCTRPMAISRQKPRPMLQATMIENQR